MCTTFEIFYVLRILFETITKINILARSFLQMNLSLLSGKIFRTFNDFCNDFSRVVYCYYLHAVRSTWTRLALKAAIGIRKCTPGLVWVCNARRNAGVYNTAKKVPKMCCNRKMALFRTSYTPPHCVVRCTLIPNPGCIFWCQLQLLILV